MGGKAARFHSLARAKVSTLPKQPGQVGAKWGKICRNAARTGQFQDEFPIFEMNF